MSFEPFAFRVDAGCFCLFSKRLEVARRRIWRVALGVIISGIPTVSLFGENAGQTLDVTFGKATEVRADGQVVRFRGPFLPGPNGETGLAVGSTQDTPSIPAAGLVGDQGTLIVTFATLPMKSENIRLWRPLLTLRGDAREAVGFCLLPQSPALYFAFKDFSEPKSLASEAPVTEGRWHQAACTWDGSTVRYFLDGVLQGEMAQPYVPKFPASSRLYLGPFKDGWADPSPLPENGFLIRRLQVHNTALAPGEIMAAAGGKSVDVRREFPSMLRVPKVSVPPVVDGKLDDETWARASSFITLIDAYKPAESLAYKDNAPRFCHDGKNLYIGFQSAFPGTYKLIKGVPRGDRELDVWGEESFEFWVDAGGKLYRFGGNVAGGGCEGIMPDMGWNGDWTYKSTTSVRIDDYTIWQGEIRIPFATLGISSAEDLEIRANFCRTWCGGERLGITSLVGTDNYADRERFATLKMSGADLAVQTLAIRNPNFGTLEQKIQAFAGADAVLGFSSSLLASSGFAPALELADQSLEVKGGTAAHLDIKSVIGSASHDALLFRVSGSGGALPVLQQVVPFKIVENYLEVVPAYSRAMIFLRPRLEPLKSKAGEVPVEVEVFSPSGQPIFRSAIASSDEIAVPFPRDGEAGLYRAVVFAEAGGKRTDFSSTTFTYHGIGPWDEDLREERVLAPFEPVTVTESKGRITVGVWGRTYEFDGGPTPSAITSQRKPVSSGSALWINGSPVGNPLRVVSSKPSRADLAGSVGSDAFDLRQETWIEYDGVLWNTIRLTARKDLTGISFRIVVPAEMAKYFHAASGGYGAGGGRTGKIEGDLKMPFWPFVWIGAEEQGVMWFAESPGTGKVADGTPVRIIRDGDQVTLEMVFADQLESGKELLVQFGLIASPVKPLPKNYPFTMFGDHWGVHLNPDAPRAPVTAVPLLINERLGDGFYDLPLDAEQPTYEMRRLAAAVKEGKAHNAMMIPYQAAIFLPEEYPEVRDNLKEWQIMPENHQTYKVRETDAKTLLWCNICPASAGATDYLQRLKGLLKRVKLEGIYFDFAGVSPCSNHYHGCSGGYTILAKREFYKKLAGILADENGGAYTIVAHNSEALQLPVFTFMTHFLNGEGLRQASSTVFHGGKDLLDHYTIADFASEHSSLPWGITSSIYSPTDSLAPEFGGDKEGGPGPQELYKFRMTKAVMAGALIHNTIPSQSRNHYGWFDKVIRFYDDFKVHEAEFLPYWRNKEVVQVVEGRDIYVSLYRSRDRKEILAVISHVSKDHADQEVVVEFDPAKLGFSRFTGAVELLTGPDPEYQRLFAEKVRTRNPVELGDFGVNFKGLDGNRIRLDLKHHSVALVRITAE